MRRTAGIKNNIGTRVERREKGSNSLPPYSRSSQGSAVASTRYSPWPMPWGGGGRRPPQGLPRAGRRRPAVGSSRAQCGSLAPALRFSALATRSAQAARVRVRQPARPRAAPATRLLSSRPSPTSLRAVQSGSCILDLVLGSPCPQGRALKGGCSRPGPQGGGLKGGPPPCPQGQARPNVACAMRQGCERSTPDCCPILFLLRRPSDELYLCACMCAHSRRWHMPNGRRRRDEPSLSLARIPKPARRDGRDR